jgi:aminoglycoside/choline kinase family phosphotransferase
MPDDTRMRAALQALLHFQMSVPVAHLPIYGAQRMAEKLALFPAWCVQGEFGQTWSVADEALWSRISARLIDSAMAQPVVAVRGGWSLADGEQPPGADGAVAGPITCDLAALLRDEPSTDDESLEIDWAVRWWQDARGAGLPVDADFGEFWRALEWMGLQRHLALLGARYQARHQGGAVTDLAPLLAAASKVALRYGPLKPLLRLLQPLQGAPVAAGYTF